MPRAAVLMAWLLEADETMIVDVGQPATRWESVATTRWGRYTSEIVEEAIWTACRMAGEPESALEVGCEGGRWSRLLGSAGWEMTCTDIDPQVLSVCQRRVPGANCVLVSRESTTLPCDADTVKLLLCLEVFPVMDSPWFAREASRVLLDRGVLVGVTLNRTSLRGLFVRIKQYVKGESGFYNLSYKEWRQRMRAAGFQITFERGYCWFPFTRASNSVLAPFFIRLERWFGLSHVPALSPWIVFIARKGTDVRERPDHRERNTMLAGLAFAICQFANQLGAVQETLPSGLIS